MKWMAGDAVEALRLRREALRVAISLGNVKSVKFYRSSLVVHLYVDGQWDDALTLADDLIAEAELEPHAGESVARERRALIRHARGDDAGALDDIRRTVDLARLVRDPQTLLPALSGWLRLAVESERWDEVEFVAEELLRELTVASVPSVVLVLDALWVARSGHVPDSLAPALATSQSAPLWEDVKTAILEERYAQAASTLSEIGDVTDEAYARLLAAEPHEVERALAFFRSVGATRYIRAGGSAARRIRLAQQEAGAELVVRLEHELVGARAVGRAFDLGDHRRASGHLRPADDPRAELRADDAEVAELGHVEEREPCGRSGSRPGSGRPPRRRRRAAFAG